MTRTVKLSEVRIDGGTQPRTALSQDVIGEYAEAIDPLPPGRAMFDGSVYWLYDGFHRYFAHKVAGRDAMPLDITDGTQRDAVLASLSVNADHGLRRTNDDKRKAVQTVLADAEWSQWSSHKIAETCRVSHWFVERVRTEAPAATTQPVPATLPSPVKDKIEKVRAGGGVARVVSRTDSRTGKRHVYAAMVKAPVEPDAPWATFNAAIDELVRDVRTISRKLSDVLEVDAATKKYRSKWAFYYQGYTGLVGWLNKFGRSLEDGKPFAKAEGKPGFVTKDTAAKERKAA